MEEFESTKGIVASRESVYIQSNEFARGSFLSDTTVHTHRLLALALSKVNRFASIAPTVEITQDELRSIFPSYARNNALGQILDEETDKLMSLRVQTRTEAPAAARGGRSQKGPTAFKKINVIGSCIYGSGVLKIEFHRQVSGHILGLKSNYAASRLRYIAELSTTMQHKLYTMLVSYSMAAEVVLSVEEARNVLGVPPAAYPEFKELRRRVLDPSLKAINEHTDLSVSMVLKRQGKRVSDLLFRIRRKGQDLPVKERALVTLMHRFGMNERFGAECMTIFGWEFCFVRYVYARLQRELGLIKSNAGGYLYTLCKDNSDPKTDHDRYPAVARLVREEIAVEVYRQLPAEQKAEVDAAFEQTLDKPGLITCWRTVGADHHSVKHLFSAYLVSAVFAPQIAIVSEAVR